MNKRNEKLYELVCTFLIVFISGVTFFAIGWACGNSQVMAAEIIDEPEAIDSKYIERLVAYYVEEALKEKEIDIPNAEVVEECECYEPEADCEPIDIVYEEDENELIEAALLEKATKIENVRVSHYCTEKYPHICNSGEPYKAADGSDVIPYMTCAVPDYIPLGSTVILDYGDGELHYYIANDRGGSIKGNRIDVAVQGHNEALELGIKYATMYWYEEG